MADSKNSFKFGEPKLGNLLKIEKTSDNLWLYSTSESLSLFISLRILTNPGSYANACIY